MMEADIFEKLNRSSLYFTKTIETETAHAKYNLAGLNLERSYIEKRAAELGAQAFEFVAEGKLKNKIGEITDEQREIALAFVRYAVYGKTD
jgi:hypothetical protein